MVQSDPTAYARTLVPHASHPLPLAHVLIEIDRGQGWRIRVDGRADLTADELRAILPCCALQYPHRAYLDGVLVGEQPALARART
jgi:hypothetical protein